MGSRAGISGRVAASNRFATPTDIANCAGWWRSDLGVSTSGSNVTAWADQSGNGRDMSQGTNAPTLVTNVYNGQPCVRFASASQQNLARASTNIFAAGAFSMYVVVKANGGAADMGIVTDSALNSGTGFLLNGVLRSIAGYGVGTWDATAVGTNLDVWAARRVAASKGTFSLNGSPVALGGASTTIVDPGGSAALVFGARNDSGALANWFNGDICEVALFNAALTDAQDFAMFTYLRARYAI